MMILYLDIVDVSIINTNAPCFAFLYNLDNRNDAQTYTFSHIYLVEEFLN